MTINVQDVKDLAEAGLTRREIAFTMGHSYQGILSVVTTNNIDIMKSHGRKGISDNPERVDRIIKLREEGLTLEEISKEMGCSRQRISQIILHYSTAPELRGYYQNSTRRRLARLTICPICSSSFDPFQAPLSGHVSICSSSCQALLRAFQYRAKWSSRLELIIELRLTHHLTWHKVAKAVGVSHSSLWQFMYRWEEITGEKLTHLKSSRKLT